jgi:hypothetical protein
MIFIGRGIWSVLDRFRKIGLSRRTTLVARLPLRRYFVAWLAILGLYVQLAAAGLCTAGLPLAPDPATGLSVFPICHSPSSDDIAAQTPGDPAPAHQHDCPFCAVHCHAAMGMAPAISGLDSIADVSAQVVPAALIVPQAARFPAGAPPRGPPTSI